MKPLPRKREHEVAASILVIAAALAGWIVFHRSPVPPKEPLVAPRITPESAASAQPAQSSNRTVELIELPASFFEPPKAAPAPPKHVKRRPVETKVAQPVAQTIEEPPPEKPVAPLKPEVRPEPVRTQPSIIPLHPETRVAKPLAPLLPEIRVAKAEPPKQLVPLQPEPPRVKPPKPVEEIVEAKPRAIAPSQKPTTLKRPAVETLRDPPPVPKAAPTIVADNPETTGEGRVLLRLFEKGSGPGIEIRWPSDASDRDRLYDIFKRCLGMRDGVIDGEGRLYLGEGPRNQSTVLNTDRYSGFVRRPEGAIAADERQEIARVRAYHALYSASPARIFPRAVDAFLIGGLRQAVGENYLNTKSVHAAYRLSGSRVIVDGIVADGKSIDSAIDLTSISSGCR